MTTPSPGLDAVLAAARNAGVADPSAAIAQANASLPASARNELPVPTWHVPTLGGKGTFGSTQAPATGVSENQLQGEGAYFGGVPFKAAPGHTSPFTDKPGLRGQTDVTRDILRMSGDERDALGQKLVDAGMLTIGYTRDQLETAWGNLVQRAADYHQANPDTNLTPEDMISQYGSAGKGPTVKDVVNTTAQLSSATQARALLESMLTQSLGRAPTGKEADDFQAALNDAQTKNPVVQHITSTYDAANNETNRSTTQTGGLDASGFADRYAKTGANTAEYRSYQAATTYYAALQQAMGAAAPVQTLR